jgi:hypothetical protein
VIVAIVVWWVTNAMMAHACQPFWII